MDYLGYIQSYDIEQVDDGGVVSYHIKAIYHFRDFKEFALDFLKQEDLNDDTHIERDLLVDYEKVDSLVYNYLEENSSFDFENLDEFMSIEKMKQLKEYLDNYLKDIDE